jgi:hypothetical protein
MIQETMCSKEKSEEFFRTFVKDWSFNTIDLLGLSRGFLCPLSPRINPTLSSTLPLGIVIDLEDQMLSKPLRLINLYGPYVDRVP